MTGISLNIMEMVGNYSFAFTRSNISKSKIKSCDFSFSFFFKECKIVTSPENSRRKILFHLFKNDLQESKCKTQQFVTLLGNVLICHVFSLPSVDTKIIALMTF